MEGVVEKEPPSNSKTQPHYANYPQSDKEHLENRGSLRRIQ
jgi:hypothetical protein